MALYGSSYVSAIPEESHSMKSHVSLGHIVRRNILISGALTLFVYLVTLVFTAFGYPEVHLAVPELLRLLVGLCVFGVIVDWLRRRQRVNKP